MGDTKFRFIRPVAPKSPYLKQVDYRIWGEMQQRLYQMKVHEADKVELKQHTLFLTLLSMTQ